MGLNIFARRTLLKVVLMFSLIGLASMGPARAASEIDGETPKVTGGNTPKVDVIFTGRIQKDLDRINKLELRREKYFRKHRGETRRHGVSKLARSRYSKAEFAIERLFPKLADYTFESLIQQAVLHNLKAMNFGSAPARIRVKLLEMRIADYSIARYRSHATTMKGIVEIFDNEGARTGAIKLTWEMIPLYTSDRGYSGREYVFLRESAYVRIAPLTLGFLEKALEQLFPGADAPGPVFIWPPKSAAR